MSARKQATKNATTAKVVEVKTTAAATEGKADEAAAAAAADPTTAAATEKVVDAAESKAPESTEGKADEAPVTEGKADEAPAAKTHRVSKKKLEKALNWAETQALPADETEKLLSSIEEHLERGLLWQNNDGTRDFVEGPVDEEAVKLAALSPAPGRRFLWNHELL
jgi:hypothetical protein